MAASARLRLFRPGAVWLALNLVVLGLLGAASVTILSTSMDETRRLVRLESDIQIRARAQDLDRADYRAFVEGAGRDLADVGIEVIAGDGTFAHAPRRDGVCVATLVPRASGNVTVRLCRAADPPVAQLALVIAAYAIVSLGLFLVLRRVERRSTAALLGFFDAFGVQADARQGLIGLLAKVRELVAALTAARQRELDLTKQAALVETARQVAHDIRSPLATLATVFGDFSALPRDARRLARLAVGRIDAIAADLLARGRGEAIAAPEAMATPVARGRGEAIVAPETTSVARTTREVVDELRARLPATSSVALSIDSGAEAAVVAIAATTWARALTNLLNNAVEATGGSGQVSVRLAAADGVVRCAVADEGPGIPPAIRARLTERGATFGKKAGSGLGLFQARQAAESCGGELLIESAPGAGTIVTIEAPSLAKAAPAGAVDLVIVDDDIWIREAWELAANRAGKLIRMAADTQELEAILPDISHETPIFLDLELGDERGDVLGGRLHQRGYRNLHVTTGHDAASVGTLAWCRSIAGKEPQLDPSASTDHST